MQNKMQTKNKEYTFANWGNEVVFNNNEHILTGKIVEFGDGVTNTKVVADNKYGAGSYWLNRDELEDLNESLENVRIDLQI